MIVLTVFLGMGVSVAVCESAVLLALLHLNYLGCLNSPTNQ